MPNSTDPPHPTQDNNAQISEYRDAEYRMGPLHSDLPLDLDEADLDEQIEDFLGGEGGSFGYVEYKYVDDETWLDGSNPGTPAPRGVPQLSADEVRRLATEHSLIIEVPYAEPLIFLVADH